MDEHPHAVALRQAVTAFDGGNLEPWMALLDDHCVWHGVAGEPDADRRDGVRRRWQAARESGWDRQQVLLLGCTDELGVMLVRNRRRSQWREAAAITLWADDRIIEAWSVVTPSLVSTPPELSSRPVEAWLEAATAFNDMGDLDPLFALVDEGCVQHLLNRRAESRGRDAMRTAWEAARRTTGWNRTEHPVVGGTDDMMVSLYRTRRDDGWRHNAWVIRLREGRAVEMWSVNGSAVVPTPA